MRIRLPSRKVMLWATVLLFAALGGGVWFAYSYATDSDTLAPLIKEQARRYLPGCRLDIRQVKVRPLVGEATLHLVRLWQVLDGLETLALQVPWLHVRHDAAKVPLMRGPTAFEGHALENDRDFLHGDLGHPSTIIFICRKP